MEEPQAGPMNTGHRANLQNAKQLKHKGNTNCCVSGCHSRRGKGSKVHFHHFPPKNSNINVIITNSLGEKETLDKRQAWEKVLCIGRPVTRCSRVCSRHFKEKDYCARGMSKSKPPKLKQFVVPSQNLPESSFTNKQFSQNRMLKTDRLKNDSNLIDSPLSKIANADTGIFKGKATWFRYSTNDKVAADGLLQMNEQNKNLIQNGVHKEGDGLKKTNRSLKKEHKGEELDSFKKDHSSLDMDSSSEDFEEEEQLEDVKNERDILEQQMKQLEDDYKDLMARRQHDLSSFQTSYECQLQCRESDVTAMKQEEEKQKVLMTVLQQQITIIKDQSAMVKEERDTLRHRLLENTSSERKNSNDLEIEGYLFRKMSYVEKRFEECESALRAMIQDIVMRLNANKTCEQCPESQQWLIDTKLELELLLDTFKTIR
nr:unnamed protein product [Callosobruchus chinensis]